MTAVEQPHADRAHAEFSPSAAKRIKACPGSLRASRGMPNISSVYAEEGTAAHELAQRCLESGKSAKQFLGDKIGKFTVTLEMAEAVQEYLNYARDLVEPGDVMEIEQRLSLPGSAFTIFGTADLLIYKPKLFKLYVIDLKYGAGLAVDAIDNDQAKMYAVMAFQSRHNWGLAEVELVIVQPRAFHHEGGIRAWAADATDLFEWTSEFLALADLANSENAPLHPGEDQCRFCPAAPVCPALKTKVMEIIDGRYEKGNMIVGKERYTPEELMAAKAQFGVVNAWMKSIETLIGHEFAQGRLPGYKRVASKSSRVWVNENPIALANELKRLYGVPKEAAYYDPELLSPAQMEPVVAQYGAMTKTAAKKEVDGLCKKVPQGTMIVPITDPRPSLDSNTDDAFNGVDFG